MRRAVLGISDRVVLAAFAVLAAGAGLAAAQEVTKEKAAQMVLDSARRAYNEGKYDFAAQRFAEYVQKYRDYTGRYAAQYGLGMCLLAKPQRDYKAINTAFRDAVQSSGLPEYPFALYYYAVSLRGLGDIAMEQAKAKPNEAANHHNIAKQHFTEAASQFSRAADTFLARVKAAAAAPDQEPKEFDWAARCRCDQSEMFLRIGSYPEARQVAEGVLAHPRMAKGPYGGLALYYVGYALFMQKEYLPAGRALSRLAPFEQDFASHAQYLLARAHHLADERPEAAAQYKAAIAGYEQRKKQAAEKLKNPKVLRPEQKAALEILVKQPTPDYVVRAVFYSALLEAEAGNAGVAATAFTDLIQKHPKSPLVAEAQLRVGYCHLQAKKPAEAAKILQPLTQKPELADRALWWLARAQIASADPKNAQAYKTAVGAAINTLKQAAQKAAERAKADPDAKVRRIDILIELGDMQQLAGQYDQAAETYKQVPAAKAGPQRLEQALQRQAAALHLAGKFKESDALCRQFEQSYPRSTLMPAILFRSAENAYFAAVAAEKVPANSKLMPKLYADAIRRYERLMRYSADFHHANMARHGLATVYYRQERYEEAAELLAKIPPFERTGDLAGASYLLADCLLRTLPAKAGDAVATARMIAHIEEAAKLLEAFLGAQPKSAEAPDALLKLAHCYRRIATLVTDYTERRNLLTRAMKACERVQREFGNHPLVPAAFLERASCAGLMGSADNAINELKRFQSDPLRNSDVAPLALVRMAHLLQSRGRAKDVIPVLAQFRQQHEAKLLADPARRDWAAMLQYAHAVALRETNKPDEAVKMFDALAEQFPGRPEAVNAAWRAGQCRRQLLSAAQKEAQRLSPRSGAKPEQIAAAQKALQEALGQLRLVLGRIDAEADNAARRTSGSPAHLHLLYEAAWCYRTLADGQIDSAKQRLQREAVAKARARLAEATPAGQAPPVPQAGRVPLSQVPVQPAEAMAQRKYRRLIAAAPSDPLAVQARLELAEMHAQRRDHPEHLAAAMALLSEALRHSPSQELAETIRLRLASCLLAQKKPKAALAHLTTIGAKPRGYYTATQALYLTGEALVQQKDWAAAVQQLTPFLDRNRIRTVRDVNERALLRLGQAHAELKQWAPSRRAYQELIQRNARSSWRAEAQYGTGRAWQSEKRYDEAVKAYADVIRQTVAEAAAKAQFQIGACLLEQKKYPEAAKALLLVPLTYDYPEWSAAARCEAARAYRQMKETAEATRLYRRVVKDHPASQWVRVARKGLDEME